MLVIYSILILVVLSPFLFVALPTWRLWQRDYGVIGGDSSKATLVPALVIFYSLVLVQGVLYMFLFAIYTTRQHLFYHFYEVCDFPKNWAVQAVREYLNDTWKKSKQDIESVEDASLFSHASELVGSESCDKYVTGVRVLGTFAKQGMDKGSIFTTLLSRAKIQKLILTLGLKQSSVINEVPDLELTLTELRVLAASIVAGFADAIHLDQFPGAARCISTLLEASEDGSSELIVHGLTILEKLALDHHNCREICRTPDLLAKIMAPICSPDLNQDTRIAKSHVVSGTFKVLRGLIRVPGKAGIRLRREISCNKQAVINLESIVLGQGNQDGHEVQILAVEIMLELVKNESTYLSAEIIQNFIKKQVQIFLADHGGHDAAAAARFHQQKGIAGKALSVLSTDSKINCTIITEARSYIILRLVEILDDQDNIRHRIFAIEILRNLCKHCELDKKLLNEFLLPKVLQEINGSKIEQQTVSSDGVGDEENPKVKEKHDSGDEKEQNGSKELMETLLSLTLQLYDLVGADCFALAVQQESPGQGAFAANLNNIVAKHSKATPASLRIVKRCCEIAISMLQNKQYREQFKELGFVKSVSAASEIMYELESTILITGPRKILRPLLSELEKKLKQELGETE